MVATPTDLPATLPGAGLPDLWCTYAAVRTLSWLGRAEHTPGLDRTAQYVRSRRNSDGGYAWTKGMSSDAWATFYCTATLTDLGLPVPDLGRTADWLRSTWTGSAYAMMPGQHPDVWATHFSTRTTVDVCDQDVPDRDRLLDWLTRLQTADGGLSWSPDHARRSDADVRACYYGIATWAALNRREPVDPPWDVRSLIAWIQRQQKADGGFVFGPGADVPCMWATYRAVGALAALGEQPAADCTAWILARRDGEGSFVRWPDYPVADVWAAFCAVGALREFGEVPQQTATAVERRIAELACAEGGFTYREPARAFDALHTAAAALTAPQDAPELPALRAQLESCQLPNEGGVMYMPGRGAEVRCTLWAVAASAFRDDAGARSTIGSWLRELQNPDGGFGYWHGRGSDLVSTASAVETWRLAAPGIPRTLDLTGLSAFVESCAKTAEGDPLGHGNVPGAPATLRAGLQAARIRAFLGQGDAAGVEGLLARHRVRGGGWANQGNRMPDLLSTYEAVTTADLLGRPVDPDHVRAFLDRTATASGGSWSPLAPAGSDALADCLHRLLRKRLDDPSLALPALSLS